LRCEEIMTTEVEVARIGDSVAESARKMRDLNIGFLPVCDQADVVQGVVTDRDLAIRVLADERGPATAVEEVMTEEVVTCRPEDDVSQVERLMRTNQMSRILCLDESGRVAGVISLADLAQYEEAGRAGEVIGDVTEREVSH